MRTPPLFWVFWAFQLGLVFLRLTDQIRWSWVWVVAPFWVIVSISVVGVVSATIQRRIR